MAKTITPHMINWARSKYLELNENDAFPGWNAFASMCNVQFNVKLGESAWRKPLQAAEKLLSDDTTEEGFLREVRIKKMLDARKEIVKEGKRYLDKYMSKELMLEAIHELSKPLNTWKTPLPEVERAKGTPIYIVSDVQEDGSGYADEILSAIADEMISDIARNCYEEVYILENGDGIDGVLRVQELSTNTGGYVQQTVIYVRALAKLLQRVSSVVKVNFSIINSNHTELRLFNIKRGGDKKEDTTQIFYEWLKDVLVNCNVNFLQNTIDNALDLSYNIFEVEGMKIFQHHGDASYMNPNRPLATFDAIRRNYGSDINLPILAHYHHSTFLKHINKNPLKSGDEQIIWVPALDPRQTKQNEISLGVSSEPAWTKLVLVKGEGLRSIETFRTKLYK